MPKFISTPGQFPCRVCGTVYQWSDQRDECEGRPYYLDEPDQKHLLLDPLGAEVGEEVIVTTYVGEDYCQAPWKHGLKLLWRKSFVREKRIVPNLSGGLFGMLHGKRYRHVAQYRIGELKVSLVDTIGDHWDVGESSSGLSVAAPFGPAHVWSRHSLLEWPNQDFPVDVFKRCWAEDTRENRLRLLSEGFDVSVHPEVTPEEMVKHNLKMLTSTGGKYPRAVPSHFDSIVW